MGLAVTKGTSWDVVFYSLEIMNARVIVRKKSSSREEDSNTNNTQAVKIIIISSSSRIMFRLRTLAQIQEMKKIGGTSKYLFSLESEFRYDEITPALGNNICF